MYLILIENNIIYILVYCLRFRNDSILQATWPSSVTGGFVIPFQGQPRLPGRAEKFEVFFWLMCVVGKNRDAGCVDIKAKDFWDYGSSEEASQFQTMFSNI